MGLAVYSTFARGIMVWERGSKTDIVEQAARFSLQSLAKELRNSFKFSGIKFSGTKDAISFPTYVNTALVGEVPKWEVGRVSYFFDSKKGAFSRRQESYIDLFGDEPQQAKEKISQVEDLEISYYFFDVIGKTYKWKSSWHDKENFPLGIRVALTIKSDEEEKEFVKTVYLP